MENNENKPLNAAEYLQYNRGIKTRLKSLYDRLNDIRSAAEYGNSALSLTGDRRADNKRIDKFGNYAAIAEQTTNEINELQKIHANMIGIISRFTDPQTQLILEQYYIDSISNGKIARIQNCDLRTVTRKKRIALEKLRNLSMV